MQPSFSPDGNQVAFAWNGESREQFDIYVKVVGSGSDPLRLTDDPADVIHGNDRIEVIKLLANAAHAGLMVFGAITALGTVGIDVTALVASLGLAGFGLGFALRDAISNVLAGVIVLMYRPFRVGDHISTGGHEGTVVGIDLRYTTIDSDDNRYLIPNANLLSRPVILPRAAAVAA